MTNRANSDELIEHLNEGLSWEIAGVIQFRNHASMVTGVHRSYLEDFFDDMSREALHHMEIVGNKIAALGGIPTVEPAEIRQASDPQGMMEASLALEEDGMEAWIAAHECAEEANLGTKFWLEEHIAEEQRHIELFELLADKIEHGEELVRRSAESG